ncbi:MAG: SAM-dependent DNA methyltransferase, partial [Clostridia bacterium]|nr:SAM-dependent DNA methyltransferase [Clostridia bacterium]
SDINEYMKTNVLPFDKHAWIDEKKTRIGYEIPFTRHFYKYIPPRSVDEVFAEIMTLEKQETELMNELLGR